MKPQKFNMVLFNAAGLGLLVFLGGYMVNSALHKEGVPRCSSRYGDGQQFALLKGDGGALSPIELQARLPTREWGVLSSARVVTDKGTAFLQVALGPHEGLKAAADMEEEAPTTIARDGVGFVWQPQNLQTARSACLSYRLYLSKDFSFDKKGTLPGLFAVPQTDKLDDAVFETGFSAKLGWNKGGAIGLTLKTPATAGMWLEAPSGAWPTNRWVMVEQEVALNTPDQADGMVRLWIDGHLVLEKTAINLGARDGLVLSGVASDVGYLEKANARSRVTLTPFIVQTQ